MLPRLAELALWLVGAMAVFAAPAADNGNQDIQPAEGRSLLAPPVYEVAEWWDVEVEDWFTGVKARGTFVVTAVSPSEASVGVAANSLHPLLFNNRLFPLGQVNAESLQYHAYGEHPQIASFPVTQGRTWPVAFGPFDAAAEVLRADQAIAFVQFRGDDGTLVGAGNYSAEVGWYQDLAFTHFAKMRVLDHGHGYSCATLFPADFRSPAYRDPLLGVPHGPLWQFQYVVPEGPTHSMVTMMSAATTGLARQQAVAPDGAIYQTSHTAGQPFHHVHAVHEDPAGTWELSGINPTASLQVFTQTFFRAEEHPGQDSNDCTSPAAPLATATGRQPMEGYGLLGTTWRLLLVGAAFLARHWRKAAFAGVRLFSRLEAGELSLNSVRSRILDELQSTNGLSTQDLRRRLRVGWGTVTYHLAVLERHGAVLHIRSGKRQVWASADTPAEQLGRVAVLGHAQARRVFEAIQASPGSSQAEIARQVGISPATVHHHVRRLQGAGAVKTVVEGRRTLHYPGPAG